MGRRYREAGTAAAALFVAAALRTTVGFLGGTPSASLVTSRYAGLRGSAAASSSAVSAAEVSLSALGWLAMGTAVATAAAVATVRGRTALRATRTEWYRKVKRIGGDRALFDVTLQKPMGVRLELLPDPKIPGSYKGIGISEIVPDGNTDQLNRKVCIEDQPGMWVLEGDRVVAVNGNSCEFGDIDDIIRLIGECPGNEVTLSLVRNTRKGPIKVVLLPGGEIATVRRGSRLSAAAEYAFGKELKYGCIDGWCGTCWHRERSTDGIFKPCCDVLTGDWDNVMPLVLTPKPEKAGDSTYLKPRGVTNT